MEHDHYPLDAHHPDSATLENDVVCCPACNQRAANLFDKTMQAKGRRIRQKISGLEPVRRKPKPKIPSRPMGKGKTQWPSRKFATRKDG